MKKRMVMMGITMMLAGVTVLGSPKGVQAETAAEETAAVFVNESDDPQYASPLQDTNAGNLFFEIPSTSRENKRLVAKDGGLGYRRGVFPHGKRRWNYKRDGAVWQ